MSQVGECGTALVLLDLMPRLLSLDLAPHRGQHVFQACSSLADVVEARGGLVVLVRSERLGTDQPLGSDLHNGLRKTGRVEIVKHTIGAFHRTDLQQTLTDIGASRLVLCGITTNLSVESTARAASDLGWDDMVFAQDAMSALTAAEHEAAVLLDLPRFGTVLPSADMVGPHLDQRDAKPQTPRR